jgi:hypothetical protein
VPLVSLRTMKSLSRLDQICIAVTAFISLCAIALLYVSCVSLPVVNLTPSGVCAVSADGKYSVCHEPISKQWSVKSTADGVTHALHYDPGTKTWRADLPAGGTVVFDDGDVRVEPPLPSAK